MRVSRRRHWSGAESGSTLPLGEKSTIARPASSALEQVPHLYFFGFEVSGVIRIDLAANRHLLDHLDAVTLETDNFLRVVGQKTELPNAEIEKDLRAESVIAQIARVTEPGICLHGVESFFLQFVGVNFCRQPDAAPFLSHKNKHSVSLLLDLAQRRVELISAIAPARTEDVAGETFAVHAHQSRARFVDLALDEREMMGAVELRPIQMQIEIAVI